MYELKQAIAFGRNVAVRPKPSVAMRLKPSMQKIESWKQYVQAVRDQKTGSDAYISIASKIARKIAKNRSPHAKHTSKSKINKFPTWTRDKK